jgi:hypothetical protein
MQTVTAMKAKVAYQIQTHIPINSKMTTSCCIKPNLHIAQRVQDLVKTYSLNLSPCDFHIFRPFLKDLKVWMFTSDRDIQKAVVQYFRQQPKALFADRTHWLLHHLDTCPMPVVISATLVAPSISILKQSSCTCLITITMVQTWWRRKQQLFTFILPPETLCKQCLELFATWTVTLSSWGKKKENQRGKGGKNTHTGIATVGQVLQKWLQC